MPEFFKQIVDYIRVFPKKYGTSLELRESGKIIIA